MTAHHVRLPALVTTGVLTLLLLTVGLVSGEPLESRPDPFPAELYPALYLAVVGISVLSWRSMTMAVYSTRTTLTIRSIMRTRNVEWSDVAAVRSVADKGYGLPAGRFTLWLRLRTGEKVRLPVQRRATPREEAFLKGHQRPYLLLSQADYEDLLVDLRRYRGREVRLRLRSVRTADSADAFGCQGYQKRPRKRDPAGFRVRAIDRVPGDGGSVRAR